MQKLAADHQAVSVFPPGPLESILSAQFAGFDAWRTSVVAGLSEYREWLDADGGTDFSQATHFHELLATISNGRLMLAVVGEFSRGKSELINALLHLPGLPRLLPSSIGRTTMCPTELLHNKDDAPCIRLLSIDTLSQHASIAQLKRETLLWSKIRIDVNDPAALAAAMANLSMTRKMRSVDAAMLGLLAATDFAGSRYDDTETIDVPEWRYAIVNYPHPILTAGLTILDTPGLNTIGQESELTLKTLPGAQAILFMVSADAGLSKSDMTAWAHLSQNASSERVVVLNKIDTVWDGLKSIDEVRDSLRKLLMDIARALRLVPGCIFPVSARNALVGRTSSNATQVRGSGIEALERYIAGNLIGRKKLIIAQAVTASLGTMIQTSLAGLSATRAKLTDTISLLAGSANLEVAAMSIQWQALSAEKNRFNGALALFRKVKSRLLASRNMLSAQLSPARTDQIWQESLDDIAGSWTTPGLTRGMRRLMRSIEDDFATISAGAAVMQETLSESYEELRNEFELQQISFARLDLSGAGKDLELLAYKTEAFCADPKNVVFLEKSFMIQRFWQTLVEQSIAVRKNAIADMERWTAAALLPVELKLAEQKKQLETRLASIERIRTAATSAKIEVGVLSAECKRISARYDSLSHLARALGLQPDLAAAMPL
ncbi:MAG: dynamin family protein [Betaproteobacteria bacterium]